MSQLSLYIQDSTLNKIEAMAKEENVSISNWVKQRIELSIESEWPDSFFALYGSIKDKSFKTPKKLNFKKDSKRENF
jgi:hypothetical protein